MAGTGGGDPAGTSAKQAFALPGAGVAAKGRLFKGVFTLGESPGGNGVMQSTNQQLRGGLVGATQK